MGVVQWGSASKRAHLLHGFVASLAGFHYLPVDRATYLTLQHFVNSLMLSLAPLHHGIFLYNGRLVRAVAPSHAPDTATPLTTHAAAVLDPASLPSAHHVQVPPHALCQCTAPPQPPRRVPGRGQCAAHHGRRPGPCVPCVGSSSKQWSGEPTLSPGCSGACVFGSTPSGGRGAGSEVRAAIDRPPAAGCLTPRPTGYSRWMAACVGVVVCMVSRKEPGFLTVPAALRELSHCALKVGPQGRASKLNGSVVGRVSSTVEARFGAYQCLCVCVCACRSRL